MDLVFVSCVVVLCVEDNLLYRFLEDGYKKEPKNI